MLPHPSTLGLSTPQFKWMSSLSTPVIVWFVSSLEPLDRSKLDDIRGTPMDVGSLEEFIDESSSQTTTWTELWYDCMNPMTWDFRSCLFLSEMLQTLRNHCIVSTAMGPECTTQSHFCNCQDCQAYSFQLSQVLCEYSVLCWQGDCTLPTRMSLFFLAFHAFCSTFTQDQLEPGSSILMHHKNLSRLGIFTK